MIDRPIGDILKDKASPGLFSVPATTMVSEAVDLMDEKGLGSILVRDASGTMAGIFTERDLMRRVVRQRRDARTTPMSEVMTHDVRKVNANESTVGVLRVMVEHGYRHMLVVDGGKPAGVLSIRDIVRWLILPQGAMQRENRRGEIPGQAEDTVTTLRKG